MGGCLSSPATPPAAAAQPDASVVRIQMEVDRAERRNQRLRGKLEAKESAEAKEAADTFGEPAGKAWSTQGQADSRSPSLQSAISVPTSPSPSMSAR